MSFMSKPKVAHPDLPKKFNFRPKTAFAGIYDDALRAVARGVSEVRAARPGLGILVITHYQRILGELAPDVVHILVDGKVVDSGGPELARRLEEEGYEAWR